MLPELLAYSFLRFGGLAVTPTVPGRAGEGNVIVTVSDQVALTAVPAGSGRVPMLTLQFTADCGGDRSITGITVQHRGLGDARDVAGLYVLHGGRRITRSRPFANRDGVLTLPLRGFSIPACTTETLQILADFLPGAAIAGQHRVELSAAEPIEGDARIMVSAQPAPARRAVAPAVRGQLRVETLPVPGRLRVGERRALAAFQFFAEGRAQYIVRLTVTNQGSAHDDDVTDLQLEASAKPVSAVTSKMTGDQVTFTLDPPLQISRGSSRIVKVYGTIVGGTGRSLAFEIEEPSDVVSGR